MTASDEDRGPDAVGSDAVHDDGGTTGHDVDGDEGVENGDSARSGGEPAASGQDPTDDDVAETAGELAEALDDLRSELRPERQRGPMGLPAPPSPRDLLRFADEYAIPFAIAVLEANVRALKLLRGAIRLVEAGEDTSKRARTARERARKVSRVSLDRLDDALADLETAMAGNELPQNETAREVLTEARRLRSRLTDELEATSWDEADSLDAPPDTESELASDSAEDEGAPVDVESELQSIKAELEQEPDDMGGTGSNPASRDPDDPDADPDGAPASGDGSENADGEGEEGQT